MGLSKILRIISFLIQSFLVSTVTTKSYDVTDFRNIMIDHSKIKRIIFNRM